MKHHTFKSESALRDFLPKLVNLSCWFEVTPEPDDEWTVSVKDDVAHVAFGDANLSDEDSFVTPDGTLLVAKRNHGCDGCVFRYGDTEVHGTSCIRAPGCGPGIRTDKRSIIWVKS